MLQSDDRTRTTSRAKWALCLGFLELIVPGHSFGEAAAAQKVLFETKIPDAPVWLSGAGKIGGKDAPFIIDTGLGAPFLLDQNGADAFGARGKESRINDAQRAFAYRIPDVQLGGWRIPGHDAPATDLSPLAQASGIRFAGFIGWPSLSGRTLMLDYDHQKLTVSEGSSKIANYTTTAVEIEHQVPCIKAGLGSRTMDLQIDTGNNGGIFLTTAEFDRLLGEGFIEEGKHAAVGVSAGGAKESRDGKFVKGSLLGVDLAGMGVSEGDLPFCGAGLEFLFHLNFAISNTPNQFSYQPRKTVPATIYPPRVLGAILMFQEGAPVVARLKPGGGAAEKAGLKEGDKIVSMNGISAKDLNYQAIYSLCEKGAGKTVTVKVARGESIISADLMLSSNDEEAR